MKLASVVVFYNPSLENIKNIDNFKDSVDIIYVVDNSDDDIVRIKDTKKVKYIKLKENMGIAYALNTGAKQAIEDGYKWLLTLDQDSKITDNIVNKLKEFIEKNKSNKKMGLVSPYHDIKSDEEVKNVECEKQLEVMTSGNIINLDIYQKIGGFKDWLFIDCVDTDYCMNLNKNGYDVLRLNKIAMPHNLGDLQEHIFLGKKYPCYNHNPIRRYYIVRNNLYINQLYGNLYPEYCKHLIRVQKGQVKRIIMFEKNKFNKLKMMYKGYKDFKKGIKGKLK